MWLLLTSKIFRFIFVLFSLLKHILDASYHNSNAVGGGDEEMNTTDEKHTTVENFKLRIQTYKRDSQEDQSPFNLLFLFLFSSSALCLGRISVIEQCWGLQSSITLALTHAFLTTGVRGGNSHEQEGQDKGSFSFSRIDANQHQKCWWTVSLPSGAHPSVSAPGGAHMPEKHQGA